jgi:hypothetical protein
VPTNAVAGPLMVPVPQVTWGQKESTKYMPLVDQFYEIETANEF